MMAPDNACERAGLSWNLTKLAGVWALRSCQVRMDVEVLALFVPFRIFQNAFQMRYLAIQSSATRTYGFMRSLGILDGLLEWIRRRIAVGMRDGTRVKMTRGALEQGVSYNDGYHHPMYKYRPPFVAFPYSQRVRITHASSLESFCWKETRGRHDTFCWIYE